MKLTDKILNEINETRTQNYLKRQAIINKIENHPLLGKEYLQCKSMIFEIAKAKHDNKNTENLQKKFNEKKQHLYDELNKQGFDVNFLQHPYDCEICKDTGKTSTGFCRCYYNKLSNFILSNSGLIFEKLPDLSKINFDFLKDEKEKKLRNQLVSVLKEFVNKCGESDKKTIVVSGNVGVGKTYLLHGVVKESLQKNKFVVYTSAFNLNKDFLSYHCAKLEDKDEILSNYLNCDILCIDDLGTENILKNVTNEYLFLILNERLIKNKATVITTNLTLTQILEVYDERIYSRLKDKKSSIVVNITGEDIRLMK